MGIDATVSLGSPEAGGSGQLGIGPLGSTPLGD